MKKVFDQTFSGLQIDWDEDQEVEYLGMAVLAGRASYTAATCVRGKRHLSYLYPIVEQMLSPNQLAISYRKNPATWHPSWDWHVYKGDLLIEFDGSNAKTPVAVSFRDADSGITEPLEQGKDWVYVCPSEAHPAIVETRGRLRASRLARPHQQQLRCLLLSEYGSCQITGTKNPIALEACHIIPVENGGTDNAANALLLRRDLHALFDAGLIQFCLSGDEWVIHCDSAIQDRQYVKLEGKPLMKAGLPNHVYLEARRALADGG